MVKYIQHKIGHFNHFKSVPISSINDIHDVVQPLPLSISKTFSSLQTDILYPLGNNSPFPPPPVFGNLSSTVCLSELPIIDISFKWSHTVFIFHVLFISPSIML